jgi:hypothetical protein
MRQTDINTETKGEIDRPTDGQTDRCNQIHNEPMDVILISR